MLIQEAGVLCGCHGNSGPPLLPLPHFSNSPLPLRDALQSVHLEASARDPVAGTVTGGGADPAGAKWRLGEAARTGYRRPNCHEMKGGGSFMWHVSPSLWLSGHPLPRLVNVRVAAVFPHHRLWSASSVPGGLTSIMHLGSQTHAHNTHREHWVQSGDSEVKSIVCACVCVRGARLGTLVMY